MKDTLMQRLAKVFVWIIALLILLFSTTALITSDGPSDFYRANIKFSESVSLGDLPSKYNDEGAFKSSVHFIHRPSDREGKSFYGQEISVSGNPRVDKILIGVTNNLIARIEIWNKDELLESKELGFMHKMTWG